MPVCSFTYVAKQRRKAPQGCENEDGESEAINPENQISEHETEDDHIEQEVGAI